MHNQFCAQAEMNICASTTVVQFSEELSRKISCKIKQNVAVASIWSGNAYDPQAPKQKLPENHRIYKYVAQLLENIKGTLHVWVDLCDVHCMLCFYSFVTNNVPQYLLLS
jgi:hypothetical protein